MVPSFCLTFSHFLVLDMKNDLMMFEDALWLIVMERKPYNQLIGINFFFFFGGGSFNNYFIVDPLGFFRGGL